MQKPTASPTAFRRTFLAAVLALAVVIAGATLYLTSTAERPGSSGVALVGGDFTLTDQSGKRVSSQAFRGKNLLVIFGYTYCPDICPTELQVVASALQTLGKDADQIQPIFITIDPERDTPEVLKQYVSAFDPRLVGLTGTADEIAAVARSYRVYYAKVPSKSDPATYSMDHSSIIYLMDTQGRFLKHFTYTTDAAELAKGLAAALHP
jgi:protein SCO1/2